MYGTSKISTAILSHIFPIAGTSKINIGISMKRLLNNINIEALSMMNSLSIATIHAMCQNVFQDKRLRMVLMI
jgi:hypothetical protein